jgi:hypothetical protein
MWRKKEYGRMQQGEKKYKLDRRIQMRKKMIEGVAKMEKDRMAGRVYASGIRMGDGSEEGNEDESERPAKKGARSATNNPQDNNNERTTSATCKCGGQDHKRISSKDCPWRELSKKEIAQKCAALKIMRESSKVRNEDMTVATNKPTRDLSSDSDQIVDLSSDMGKKVQWTSKFGWQRGANQLCDMQTHVNHPVHSLCEGLRQGI